MTRCHAAEADLLLDGHPWRLASLREAAKTWVQLAAYKGAHWMDLQATIGRRRADATQPEQDWWAGSLQAHPRLALALGERVGVYSDTWRRGGRRGDEDVLRLPEEETP